MRKKISVLVLALIIVLTTLPVQAKAQVTLFSEKVTLTLYPEEDRQYLGQVSGNVVTLALQGKNETSIAASDKKITKLKSSKPSVASVYKRKAEGMTMIYAAAKKPGTTTISFKTNSKTYRIKVTVKKYTNPISAIKIGNTTIKGKEFKTNSNYSLQYLKNSNKKEKIMVKLKKGWELSRNEVMYYTNTNEWGIMGPSVIKNKSSVRINAKEGFCFSLNVRRKSTGQSETIDIFLN